MTENLQSNLPKEERLAVATKLLLRRSAVIPSLAYFGGRTLRYIITDWNPNISYIETARRPMTRLDNFVYRQSFHQYNSKAQQKEEAYTKEFPIAITLDTLASLAIGIPLSVPAFIVGLLYTDKEDFRDIQKQ